MSPHTTGKDLPREPLDNNIQQSQGTKVLLLAAGAAHNLNNLLGSIAGAVSVYEQRQLRGAVDREHIARLFAIIKRSTERAICLADELKELAVMTECDTDLGLFDVNKHLQEVVGIVSGYPQAQRIEFRINLKDELKALCTESGLQQVLLNLILNAIDAMDLGGAVTISSHSVDAEHIFIEIADEGGGIPVNAQADIFRPFFSTKKNAAPGRFLGGTGLGLSVVRILVESWGGSISYCGNVDRGTVFKLSLLRQGLLNQD